MYPHIICNVFLFLWCTCAIDVTPNNGSKISDPKRKTKFHTRKCCSFSIGIFTINHTTTLDKYTIKR